MKILIEQICISKTGLLSANALKYEENEKMPPQAAILVRDSAEASKILVDALETVIKNPLGHAALNLVAKAAGMGDYILTGLEVYIYREPCLMCSMALSHSRIKRLFYLKKCGTDGSCGTRESIHTLPALNHRFQVFYGTHSVF